MVGISPIPLLIESFIMLPFLSRGCFAALVVLQIFSPALAWEWYEAEDSCGYEVEWGCCESEMVVEDDFCGCEQGDIVVDECGCGGESVAIDPTLGSTETTEPTPAPEPTKQPEPSQSNKTRVPEPAIPQVETPQPALDPAAQLPPAPINVPQTSSATESEGSDLFPGPAAESSVPAETEPRVATPTHPVPAEVVPPTTPAATPAPESTPPSDDAGSLFEEPAAESTPANESRVMPPVPAAEKTPSESLPIDDDVFGEPVPRAEKESIEAQSTGAGTPESTVTPESKDAKQPAADPLDDLFGPSSAVEQPKKNFVVAPQEAVNGLAKGEFREWSNRNNDFQCQGHLIRITADGVFIAQPNGAVMAIAYSQLSDADLAFVRSQVEIQRAMLAAQGADSQIASHSVQ
jgi:hypothetical protein